MERETLNFELEKPVLAHGETITSLELKPPSGANLINSGWPFITERTRSGDTREIIHWNAARLLLSDMAQVPPSTIDALTPSDKYLALEGLKSFFLYRTPPKSSRTSSAGESGPAHSTT